ncbi:hypothetical protein CDAR_464491 [Caerostris darwini]|uniref:Uncharacterized protein n=1 Tax=Caerostris darwini TaxID=1538125 RepID=A0AAV4VU32_9ARAC|nr:hypothetical protein CDAR_464491 [Caerostris darwini]
MVLWKEFLPDGVPLRTVIYDMIPVLQYVSTGTRSALSKESFLIDTDATVSSQQLVGEEATLYTRDLYFREKYKDLSSFGASGPAVLPRSHNFHLDDLFNEGNVVVRVDVYAFFLGSSLAYSSAFSFPVKPS